MNTQERLAAALKNPLQAGYVTYYTAEAARPGISGQAREFLLDQRHRFFVLISES